LFVPSRPGCFHFLLHSQFNTLLGTLRSSRRCNHNPARAPPPSVQIPHPKTFVDRASDEDEGSVVHRFLMTLLCVSGVTIIQSCSVSQSARALSEGADTYVCHGQVDIYS
jgi:hypothetical protein